MDKKRHSIPIAFDFDNWKNILEESWKECKKGGNRKPYTQIVNEAVRSFFANREKK
jgi:hypothetical protein